MGKKRFDHRFLACVARGKCVEGVELPVINPAENVVEGRIDASRKPRKSLAHKQKVVKQMRISDDRIIDAFEKWRRTAGKPARKAGLLAGEGENSVDMALKMLRDKARLREVNKLGAELEDIKDRMVNVVNDYEDLLEMSPFSRALDVDIEQMLENNNLIPWKNAVSKMIFGYEDKCKKREEVLETLAQSLLANEAGGTDDEEAPSIYENDLEAVEKAGSEIVGNLENLQIKTRKLNFLHYSILKSGTRGQTDEMNLKAHREIDLQKKVVDRFRSMMAEKKNRRSAWKYAADEIVGLLKSVRKEGNHKLEELETSFTKLLETFQGQSEELEKLKNDLRMQKQTVTITEEENKRVKNDNLLLQGQLETANKERKMTEQISSQLEKKLQAHLEEVDEEDLYKPVNADDEEAKDIVYIKRTKKLKTSLKQLQEENEKLKSENSSLQKMAMKEFQEKNAVVDENQADLTSQGSTEAGKKECLECTILGQNMDAISSELMEERDKVKALEEEILESQVQLQRTNQELLQLRIQNSKLIQMSQKVESAGPSTVSLQSSQSIISAHPPYCPPEVSNDQLSSADESGYTSHEISTANLEAVKKKEKAEQGVHKSAQTDKVDSLSKGVQVLIEGSKSSKNLEVAEEMTMNELSRMAKEKSFNDEFTGALGTQISNVCKTIVNLTGLVNLIRSRATPTPESVHAIYERNSHKEVQESSSKMADNSKTGQSLSEITPNAPSQLLESSPDLQATAATRVDITENEQQQSKDPKVINGLEREIPKVVVESKENIPSVSVTVNENIPARPDNIVSSARQQDSSLRTSSDTKKKSQQRLAPLNEAIKTKLSIINLDLPLQDDHRTNHHQNRLHTRPSSSHLLPVSQSRCLPSKHDFRKSFNELKEHIKSLEEPENNERKAPNFDKFSNELRSSESGSRRTRASKVIKALRDFALKSWHDLEVLTGEMLEDYSASDDDILQEYIKLVAEHAFKILQVIGITIWKISMNEKNNVDLIVKEDEDLKSFHSFPDIFGENDETHGQLITEKSGIWLPMIAVSDEQKSGYQQIFEQIQGSTVKSKPKSEEREKQEGLSLPVIKKGRSSAMANRTKKMLGIGGHSIAASRSDVVEKKQNTVSKRTKANNSSKKSHQNDFRSSRILDKNKKLVNLLKQGGKTMHEINVILGLRQGKDDSVTNKPTNSNAGMENCLGLGLTSRHISLPKLPSTHHMTSESSKPEPIGPQGYHPSPRSKPGGSVLMPKKVSEGADLLAFGNSWKKKPTDKGQRENATQSQKLDHINSRIADQRRATHFIGHSKMPLLAQAIGKQKVEGGGPINVSIKSQGRDLEIQNTMPWKTDRKLSLAGAGQFGNNLKESLLSQRRQRKMSYAVNHNVTSTIELPNLAVNNQLLSPREGANGFE
ncbi:myosin-13-like [Rhopilema esculentum]|uniref:myosin-13-like n=1 Tax=Rhopilema esculentum TaxID=499914 RepID=UPI0031D4BA85